MRLATFKADGKQAFGIVSETGLIDASRHLPGCPSLKEALAPEHRTNLQALAGRASDYSFDACSLLRPVTPGKVFCVLLNYESSRLAQGRPKLQYPHIVTRFADCHVGPCDPIVKPRATKEFDYEGEVAVVIGRRGRNIAVRDAIEHVAGLTAYNDATPRDWMRHTRHFTAAKNFPATAAFGPWIATLDDLGPLEDVALEVRVNGELMQQGKLGELTFPVAELVAYISEFTELHPGDIIATGTPGGSGYKRMPPRFLKAGDLVEVKVHGVGILANHVIDEG